MVTFAIICLILAFDYLAVIAILRAGLMRVSSGTLDWGHTFSVVVAARNEQESIGRCLDALLGQDIARNRYEIIIVNDRSTDRTAEIVRDYSRRDSRVRLVEVSQVSPGVSPKKNAVATGVATARNTIVACTDADCVVPAGWLSMFDRHMHPGAGFVQGMVAYERLPGSSDFFHAFQALDFMSHGIVAAGAIGASLPLNGNANNMAYRREVFDKLGGFERAKGVLLGDDDLLMQSIWRDRTWVVKFAGDREGLVRTRPARDVGDLLTQRARWGSVSLHYGPVQIVLLLAFFLFYMATAGCIVASAFLPPLLPVAAVLLVVKLAGELVMMVPAARLYGQLNLLPWLPLVSLLHLPMVLISVFAGAFGRHSWKG